MWELGKKRIKNIVYGFAIGDALGVPFEFKSSEYCKKYYTGKYETGTHNQKPGTWSDDTSILLCVLDSKGDIEKYKQNLIDWNNNSPKFNCFNFFDIGSGTKQAIQSNFTNDSSQSKGNACLCVALGCWLLGMSFEYCEKYIRLAHNNDDAVKASEKYYWTLRGVLVNCIEKNIKNNGFCLDSFKISLKCSGDKTYKFCVNDSINEGGDTDSHAAFTGALAAKKYKIPKYYIDNLQGKEKIDFILSKL